LSFCILPSFSKVSSKKDAEVQYFLKLPQMGESVAEATLTAWLKDVGDAIEADAPVVEVATDKVDSDVVSEVSGILKEKRFNKDEIVKVGDVIAVIETDEEIPTSEVIPEDMAEPKTEAPLEESIVIDNPIVPEVLDVTFHKKEEIITPVPEGKQNGIYSPLVKNIAAQEGIGLDELEKIPGTGKENRVTKEDILNYVAHRNASATPPASSKKTSVPEEARQTSNPHNTPHIPLKEDKIIEMGRMEKLIADHMRMSKQTSAHVQSFVEADVTQLWNWREKAKRVFAERGDGKLTFTPLFMAAVIKALKDYPILNSSVEGDRIIQKKAINIGMATALPNGNLIVPVIKNADLLNLMGLSQAINDLAQRARNNQLKPDEVQQGTYTLTNIGNFGSLMGTPIINQPQVGILAVGVIRKVPAVMETEQGDFIGIRKKIMLSHSYDHRVINGATGGLFVKAVADYLEHWDEPLPEL